MLILLKNCQQELLARALHTMQNYRNPSFRTELISKLILIVTECLMFEKLERLIHLKVLGMIKKLTNRNWILLLINYYFLLDIMIALKPKICKKIEIKDQLSELL